MMRRPSIATLRQVSADNAAELRRILGMRRAELLQLPAGAARAAECWHAPTTGDVRMHCLDAAAGTHGVEAIETAAGGEFADYLNAGDTYAVTVIRWRGVYRVQSLGDFIERNRVKFR